MKWAKKLPDHLNVGKAATYAIVINSMQVAAVIALALYIMLDGKQSYINLSKDLLIAGLALVVSWGAVMDIREAVNARRMTVKMSGLDETVSQMSDLNRALRVQRHDFFNHLQVVYSLMEMKEYQEAQHYLEQVYGDIRSLSRTMKTACAPVNALLRAKTSECEQAGIRVTVDATAAWDQLPLPAWEMCRVLSNLMDNGRDALRETSRPEMTVELREDLHSCSFRVMNNGPEIPEEIRQHIFEPGFSQKGEGRGLGLYIARQTLRSVGGDLTVESDAQTTVFSGWVPRNVPAEKTDGSRSAAPSHGAD